ncbi:MAG: D-aminoacyl-tRNA deacylase [Anaerolineae bacterium]
MRAVVQRVVRSSVNVNGQVVSQIGRGLNVLIGIRQGDTEEQARWMAHKIAGLRIFEDEDGKMNLSVRDVGGEVLVVSQFTLYGDAKKGFRPSFVDAAPPDIAAPLIDRFVQFLREEGAPVRTGVFQAMMLVEIHNDGPVTIILEREP